MFNINYRDYGYLLLMREAIGKIERYTVPFDSGAALYADGGMYDATLMQFIVIAQMAEKLSEEFKDATEDRIDWFVIKGFRNLIAHDYMGILPKKVWEIIKDDLPALNRQLEELLKI